MRTVFKGIYVHRKLISWYHEKYISISLQKEGPYTTKETDHGHDNNTNKGLSFNQRCSTTVHLSIIITAAGWSTVWAAHRCRWRKGSCRVWDARACSRGGSRSNTTRCIRVDGTIASETACLRVPVVALIVFAHHVRQLGGCEQR